ncbi:MAG: hypothetical protein J1E60_06625 [Christensenellaceae bacterium]|nr:hypothetical protein [Christensenellaceae bacterium]
MKRITEKLKRPSVTNDERSDYSIECMTLSEAALYAISYLAIALIVVAFTFMSLAVFPACTKVNGANATEEPTIEPTATIGITDAPAFGSTEKPVELPTEEPKNLPTKDWPRIVEPVPTEVPDGLGEKELSILNGEIVSLTGGKAVDDGFSGVSIDIDLDGEQDTITLQSVTDDEGRECYRFILNGTPFYGDFRKDFGYALYCTWPASTPIPSLCF